MTIDDLAPQPFEIKVKGVTLVCKPLRLSHALTISKIGAVLQGESDIAAIQKAESDMDAVISTLIPELEGKELDMATTMTIINAMLESIQPEDTKELQKAGVTFDGPKVAKNG